MSSSPLEPFPDVRSPRSSLDSRDSPLHAADAALVSPHSPSAHRPLEMDRLDPESGRVHFDNASTQRASDKPATRRRRAATLTDPELDMTLSPANLANRNFVRKATVNVVLIGLWYLFSVSISVYNKWMFGDGQLDFHFPLFTTSMHMLVQFALSSLILFLIPSLRPQRDPERPSGPAEPLISPWFYATRIAPCATATGLDIGLGNTSLRYVTLIFFTMCKSSTLGFVLLFAILFRLERPSLKLAGIITIMTVGVIMMVAGETAFSALGFTLLMLASLFSGLRWSLTQMLLRRNPATSNPFASLFFLTPIMFVVLLILAIPMEGFGPLMGGLAELADKKGNLLALALLVFPGCLAFMMTSAEFALLKRTSVVTLSVCGIFKEVVTIAAGGIIFEETLTPINISGLFVTILAIATYNYMRMIKMKQKAMEEAQDEVEAAGEEHAPMLAGESSRDDEAAQDGHYSTSDTLSRARRSPSGSMLPAEGRSR